MVYLKYLEELKRRGINVGLITGHELGAVIATLFAFGSTPEEIQWRFFRLGPKLEKKIPFSHEWRELILKEFAEELNNKDIADAPIPLAIPVGSLSTRSFTFYRRGDVLNALENNLRLFHKENRNCCAAFQWGVFDRKIFLENKISPIIALEGISGDIEFRERPEEFIGIYGRAYGIIKRQQNEVDIFVRIADKKTPLDNFTDNYKQMNYGPPIIEKVKLIRKAVTEFLERKKTELSGMIYDFTAPLVEI